jgi:hypothetical protein
MAYKYECPTDPFGCGKTTILENKPLSCEYCHAPVNRAPEFVAMVYVCFHKGKRCEIWTAKTTLEARTRAARLWNLKPSQERDVTAVLASKDGAQVTQTTIL